MNRNNTCPELRCELPSLAEFDSKLQELARRDAARSRNRTLPHMEPFTLEQTDFIVYRRREKAWGWVQISDAFTRTWGRERTVASLQACYQSSTRTPCWGTEGPLCPREDDAQHPLLYDWVDRVTKRRARALGKSPGQAEASLTWGEKRNDLVV